MENIFKVGDWVYVSIVAADHGIPLIAYSVSTSKSKFLRFQKFLIIHKYAEGEGGYVILVDDPSLKCWLIDTDQYGSEYKGKYGWNISSPYLQPIKKKCPICKKTDNI